ncbi:hypothetical protein HDV00_010071 [Rhizophlyctis rosea]|nr:hypothetical protein HDV00_010071 [Rhizophlyctis rosea]
MELALITDALLLLKAFHSAIQKSKANAVSRSLLSARVEPLTTLLESVDANSLPSSEPVAAALSHLSDTLTSAAAELKKLEKKNALQRLAGQDAEQAWVLKVDRRLTEAVQQLRLKMQIEGAKKKTVTFETIIDAFTNKEEELQRDVQLLMETSFKRCEALEEDIRSLTQRLKVLIPESIHERTPSSVHPGLLIPTVSTPLAVITSILKVGKRITAIVGSICENQVEVEVLTGRVTLLLDGLAAWEGSSVGVGYPLRDLQGLEMCLKKCDGMLEKIARQTSLGKNIPSQVIAVELRSLNDELSRCIERLGLDLQLKEQVMNEKFLERLEKAIHNLGSAARSIVRDQAHDIALSIEKSESMMATLDKYATAIIDNQQRDTAAAVDGMVGLPNLAVDHLDQDVMSVAKELFLNIDIGVSALSPEGSFLVVSSGKTATMHKTKYGNLSHYFVGHTGDIIALAIFPDGAHIVSAADEEEGKMIRVWDTKAGVQSHQINISSFHTKKSEPTNPIILSCTPNNAFIIASDATGTSVWYNKPPFSRMLARKGHKMLLSGDGTMLITYSTSELLIIPTSNLNIRFKIPIDPTAVPVISRNGVDLCITSQTSRWKTYCTRTGSSHEFDMPVGWVLNGSNTDTRPEALFVHRNKNSILASAGGNCVYLFDVTNGKQWGKFGSLGQKIVSIAVRGSENGENIAYLTDDGYLEIRDLWEKKLVYRLAIGVGTVCKEGDIQKLVVTADGKAILVQRQGLVALVRVPSIAQH